MLRLILNVFHLIRAIFRSRSGLAIENLALRQQLAVLKARGPRPRLTLIDRVFWISLRRLWSKWADALVIVKPETVVRWHRAGFKAFWRWKSGRLGRPAEPEVIERWKVFLRNHREGIAAMDFFTVPTATFQVLYVLIFIRHARRQILHFNVSAHPGTEWIIQQLREAFPYDMAPRYLIFDRDDKFGQLVVTAMKSMGIKPSRTTFRSPWQKVVVERWIGTVRRELLNHVVILNELHLRRLLRDYVSYYHADRTHLGLQKEMSFGERQQEGSTDSIRGKPAKEGELAPQPNASPSW